LDEYQIPHISHLSEVKILEKNTEKINKAWTMNTYRMEQSSVDRHLTAVGPAVDLLQTAEKSHKWQKESDPWSWNTPTRVRGALLPTLHRHTCHASSVEARSVTHVRPTV
jgi:hypothetical protein